MRYLYRSALNLLLLLSLLTTACGSSDDGNSNNQAPTADAGDNQAGNEGSTVTLNGSGSDTDGSISSYAWVQLSGPSLTLDEEAASQAELELELPWVTELSTIEMQLTVSDDDGASSTDTVSITVANVSFITFRASKDQSGRMELYRAPIEGGEEPVKLSAPLVPEGDVVSSFVSPNGQYVAYVADQETDEVHELYIVSSLGGEVSKINDLLVEGGNVAAYSVRWSPDSRYLAYLADAQVDELNELYIATPDGEINRKVSASSNIANPAYSVPNWSPNSAYLAYRSDHESTDIFNLYVIDIENNTVTKMNPDISGELDIEYNFTLWAPDSRYIAYRGDLEVDEQINVYTNTPDGNNHTKVNGLLAVGGNVSSFSWAPDSSLLAYRADQLTDNQYEIFTVAADGSQNRKVNGTLANNGSASSYSWSPNSRLIAYRAEQETENRYELYTATPAGDDNFKVNAELASGGEIYSFQWLADSNRLLYIADAETIDKNELYIAETDGESQRKLSHTLSGDLQVLGTQASPDGERAFFYIGENINDRKDIFIVTTSGSTPLQVNNDLVPDGLTGILTSWSADSRYIIYRANQNSVEVLEIYSYDVQANTISNVSGSLVDDAVIGIPWVE